LISVQNIKPTGWRAISHQMPAN